MKELLEKVILYLKENDVKHIKNSVSYRGVRKNIELIDGKKKDMHSIAFLMPLEYEDAICYIHADAKTNRLEYLITPHIFEKIDFD